MDVECETRWLWRVTAYATKTRDIDAVKRGIHRDVITILHTVCEVCRLSVDHDDIDFGMRDAERLDNVLHRSRTSQCVHEAAVAQLPWQEVIQRTVKAEPDPSFRPGSDEHTRTR